MSTPSIWPYFTVQELSCRCGQCDYGPLMMSHWFMGILVEIRSHLGFPLPLSSSIRCPKHNNVVSTTGLNGPHTTGKCVDVRVYGDKAAALIQALYDFHLISPAGGYGGLGIKQYGPLSGRFIHIDSLSAAETMGPRPWIWGYNG